MDKSLCPALGRTCRNENAAETDGGHMGVEPPSWAEIAQDGFPYPPFKWDEERQARLRAELDYILETFPIVKRKDIEKYGNYRTKETILEYYEKNKRTINGRS